jgi:2'-5' RNA ligase
MQRLFIGIPVDNRSQRKINEILKPIKVSNPDIRWVAEANRHLTLAFLGNIPDPQVETLRRYFEKTYRGCLQFNYRFTRLTRFPRANSGIIALTGEANTAVEHLFRVTRRFLQKHEVGFDSKGFRPHVTLGRIKARKNVNTSFLQTMEMSLAVDKVRLYQSRLTESGSIYTTLEETRLCEPYEL